MTNYIAFLRAVNVGGTGRLPMAELRRICKEEEFTSVQTYIASGNVLFRSDATRQTVRTTLESRLHEYLGKEIPVVVRTATELRNVLENNPFSGCDPKRTVAIFLHTKPPKDALENIAGLADEQLSLGKQEIYVHYGSGMANSKLRIPAAKTGTARNMNTIAKMVELVAKSPTR